MNPEFDIVPEETADKIRVPASQPYIMLRLTGASYVNKKAAQILNLQNGDTLQFYRKQSDGLQWFIGSDPLNGATVYKSGNLFKFCHTKAIRRIFDSLGVQGKKAFFTLTPQLEPIPYPGNPDQTGLFVKPKPFNVE